jgi:predicted phosphodiesterase
MRKYLHTILFLLFFLHLLPAQIKFAWITDTHIGSPDAEKDLVRIIKDINEQDIRFVIITGDITEKGQTDELIQAKNILSDLKYPYFIISGNHDTKWSESGCTKFTVLFGDDKFIFNYQDYCFIGLNSGIPLKGGGGHISAKDLDWLNNKLSKLNPETKIIFAVHHQLDGEIDNYREVISQFFRFKKVFVIVGHGHTNRAYDFGGIKGAMGRSALSKGKNPGYNLVTLSGDSIEIQTIDFSENKIWYRNSILKSNQQEKAKLISQVELNKFKEIFDSKNTLVKTGIFHRNKLFISDLSGFVYSLDLNGKLLWKSYFPTSFFARPIVYKNNLIVCGTDGKIYFLNLYNGKLKKNVQLSSSIVASPIILQNKLIVFSNDGCINFIELKDLITKSYKIAGKNFESIPAVKDDKIIIGNWDSFLYSIKTIFEDSNLINWKWTENKNFYYSPAVCTPLIDNFNRVFVSTPDKFISGIDFYSGNTVFRSNEYNSWESIGMNESKNLLLIKSLNDTIYALDLTDSIPKLKWKKNLSYGLDTNPIQLSIAKGKVFVPAKNGYLYILDEQNGELLNSFFFGHSRLNDVIFVNDNLILISNMDGKIFKLTMNKRKK